jgi:ABC-2 type transport system ATP-binding protein
MIEITKLSKHYKNHHALDDINLQIPTGMFGLLGPNGAGKTTLMRTLATLLKPTDGDITMNTLSIKDQPDKIRHHIGYLPQHFKIYPGLTGYEFLDYVAVMKGIKDKKHRRNEIEQRLEDVNLQDKAKKKIKTYSGGMRQRLGIAQALMGNPDVLIVDEPTAGLDPEERIRFRNLLARFSLDRTVILSTHIVADIESSCQQLAVLHKGSLVLNGSLQELQQQALGRVWEFETSGSASQHEVLRSTQVISTRKTPSGLLYRVIADEAPSSTAKLLQPTLEDGYLALIGGADHV